jgi:opacity protein-like surface antigen
MRKMVGLFVVGFVVLSGMVARAENGEWDWNITPYAWLLGLDGDIAAKGLTTSVDETFLDAVSKLTVAGMLHVDGNNGDWGTIGDLVYLNMDDSSDTAIGEVKGGVDQWIISVIPYLRVKSNESTTLDLGIGARYLNTSLDIDTPIGSTSDSKSWIDPVLLARVNIQATENLCFSLMGDIGGFGISSDFTWQAAVNAGYKVSELIDLMLGFRYLDVDYTDSDFRYDAVSSGFTLGVRFIL